MCGIAGVVGPDAVGSRDPLAAALTALAARGPDAGGRVEARLGAHPVALGARRLALVDPSGGHQPVVRPSGAVLAMNGEVYNHRALRLDLERQGEKFKGRSDTEVLAALLDVEGVAGLARVEGSYAFAFLGSPDGPLLLGRDPVGVRPLAFGRAGRSLVFASTLDGLLAPGLLDVEPDLEAVADLLRDGVVLGSKSAVRGVQRVLPGEVVCVARDLSVSRLQIPTPAPDERAADGGVLEALRVAVADRLRLDRPACVFLSGGIDSALVASLAREGGRIPTYTLTFPGHGELDEGRRAARTAERLGMTHLEVPCPTDPTPWVLGAARAFDEPFADASAVPTWGLAKAVGAAARVALTGTGGDEVFGGYRRYWLLGTGPWLRHVPEFVREPVATVLERTVPPGARLLRAAADPEGLYRGLMRLQGPAELERLGGPLCKGARPSAAVAGPTTPGEAMADDRRRYLPFDLLVKEDRALMAHGVEGRHPFLDRRVGAAAARLEGGRGQGRGRQKQLLRAYVRELIDPDLAEVGKHGFAFPCDALYAGPLHRLAQDVLTSRRARDRGFTDPEETRRLLREHASGKRPRGAVVHALVMLELWARRVLDRASLT